jgi:hypothetical protein
MPGRNHFENAARRPPRPTIAPEPGNFIYLIEAKLRRNQFGILWRGEENDGPRIQPEHATHGNLKGGGPGKIAESLTNSPAACFKSLPKCLELTLFFRIPAMEDHDLLDTIVPN